MRKNLAVKLLAPMALACLAVGGFALAPTQASATEAEAATFTVKETVEIRLANPTGIRFTAEMSEAYYTQNAAENVKFGMMIMPTVYLNLTGTGENVDYIKVMDEQYKSDYLMTYDTPELSGEEGDTNYYYTGSNVNVLLDNYFLDFVGIAFKETTVGETVTYEYADFDAEKVSANVFETAAKSLNVAGWGENPILQGFVANGVASLNKEEKDSIAYDGIADYLGLAIETTTDHIELGASVDYSLVSTETKDFAGLDIVLSGEGVTIADGKITAAKEGAATVTAKLGELVLAEKTFYVGNEVLELYSNDYNFSNERNGRSMQNPTHNGNPGNVWGLSQKNIATKGMTDVTDTDVATAYETKFGEKLTEAYKLGLNIEAVEGKPYRLLELRIPLTDAKYVFETYKAVTVRMMINNIGTASTTVPYVGMFVTKDGTGDGNLAGTRTTGVLSTGAWLEYSFPLALTDAYAEGSVYRLTIGMDIVQDWVTADVYFADIEFETSYKADMLSTLVANVNTNSDNASWLTDGNSGGYWGKGGAFAQKGGMAATPADLATAYEAKFGEKAKDQVYTVSPDFSKFILGNGTWEAVQNCTVNYTATAGNVWYDALTTHTKIKVRVYIVTSVEMVMQAGVYTFAGEVSAVKTQAINKANVTAGVWQEIEFAIPANVEVNTKFTLGFNYADSFNIADRQSQSSTIYVADFWFE